MDLIADVSLAVPTSDAAQYLLEYIGHYGAVAPRTGEYLRHAALHLPADRIPEIVTLVQKLDNAPLPQRLAAADGLSGAARERGIDLPAAATEWIQHTIVDALAALPVAPPDLATTIAGTLAKSDAGAEALLDVIESGKASPALLRNDAVAESFGARSTAVRERANALTQKAAVK